MCVQVYYASEEFGLDSVVTAEGYYLMANVFVKQEKTDITLSLYSEVHQHLLLTVHNILLPVSACFNLYVCTCVRMRACVCVRAGC